MAIYYHIDSNDFVFNYEDLTLTGGVKGYFVTLQRSAHTKCNCFQGIPFNVFCPHSEAYGEFPMHYTAFEHLVFQQLPDFMVQRYSCGWVKRSALQRVFDPTILL